MAINRIAEYASGKTAASFFRKNSVVETGQLQLNWYNN